MDDALLNCATGVCCPPEAQIDALARAMVKDSVCKDYDDGHAAASWIVKRFDLAEKGTLEPLKKSIARLAKA